MYVDKIICQIKELNEEGEKLYFSLALNDENAKKNIELKKIDIEALPNFITQYEQWYSQSQLIIKQFLPERYSDFIKFYKDDKRKNIDISTYCIQDYVLGYTLTNRVNSTSTIVAMNKFEQQRVILASAERVVNSTIYNLKFELSSEIFDSEIESAQALLKAKFFRAAGAIAGVILEKHFSKVLDVHNIEIEKTNPHISDYNEKLRKEKIIDLPTWRHIQLLGDLRNLCDHDKKVEPTKTQVEDLIAGIKKIISTIF